jgi:hypothetical protein
MIASGEIHMISPATANSAETDGLDRKEDCGNISASG